MSVPVQESTRSASTGTLGKDWLLWVNTMEPTSSSQKLHGLVRLMSEAKELRG